MGQSQVKVEPYQLTVRPCPWCKETHLLLTFQPLLSRQPGGPTHVGVCPCTGKKINAFPPGEGPNRK